MAFARDDILRKFRENIKKGIPIIGTGAGTGLSAKCEEMGGSDLIIIYNSGWFRMQGRASVSGHMPLGDANGFLMEMATWVLPVAKNTPVIAGVFAHDSFRNIPRFLKEVKEIGFSGVQNYPTLGMYDGKFKAEIEEVGYSYDNEVELIRIAHDMDLLTTPYVYNIEHTEKMVRAGGDLIVAHCGCTTGGSTGVTGNVSMGLDEACRFIQEIRDCAVSLNPDAMVISHGGPVATPKDVEYLMENTTGVVGFYGASSIERLPVEIAIANCVKEFKSICIKNK
jgi:predicted TIM-barrel enzyme